MKHPKELTNDDLALALELWAMLNKEEFTESQQNYFEEIVWRLRLMSNKEQEINNE